MTDEIRTRAMDCRLDKAWFEWKFPKLSIYYGPIRQCPCFGEMYPKRVKYAICHLLSNGPEMGRKNVYIFIYIYIQKNFFVCVYKCIFIYNERTGKRKITVTLENKRLYS